MNPRIETDCCAEGVPAAQMADDGYLTDRNVAAKLKWSPKTLEAKGRPGVFQEGVHFFQKPAMRRRWKWSAVVRWLEGGDDNTAVGVPIPLASPAGGRVR